MKSVGAAAQIIFLTLFVAPLFFAVFSRSLKWCVGLSVTYAFCASLAIVIWHRSFFPFEEANPTILLNSLTQNNVEVFFGWISRTFSRISVAFIYSALAFKLKERVRGRRLAFSSQFKQAYYAVLAFVVLQMIYSGWMNHRLAERAQLNRTILDDITKQQQNEREWLKRLDSIQQKWSRLSEQIFRVDKWSLCRG